MPVIVFYTSINGFLPHLFYCRSICAMLRLAYEKHEMSQGTVRHMLKIIERDAIKSLLKQR